MTYTPHPLRIRLSRQKGYRKPAGAVVVSRPTRWGNPFRACSPGGAAGAVEDFRAWLAGELVSRDGDPTPPTRAEIVAELRGKLLACWCPLDAECHGDVLAEIANQERP